MSHYETLGVDPKASADEVKRAYRKKAAKAHPDRGGDGDKMAELNKAHEVLVDPRRRQIYDSTGENGGRPVDEQAHKGLQDAFAAALEADLPNLVVGARRVLQLQRDDLNKRLHQAQRKVVKLLSRRDKVRSKTKVNIVHALIDQAVQDLDALVANAEEALQVNAAVSKLLDAYESDEPVEFAMPARGVIFTNF